MDPVSESMPGFSMEDIAMDAETGDREDMESQLNKELNTEETLDPKQPDPKQQEAPDLEDNGLLGENNGLQAEDNDRITEPSDEVPTENIDNNI